MPVLRTVIAVAILCALSVLAVEPPLGSGSGALARQAAEGEMRGGLQQVQPGHYVYLHTDDTPGVSSTFNSGFIQGHRQILLDVREAVERQIAQGATEDEAVAGVDLPQYRRFQGYSTAMEMAVRRTYLELTTGLD